MFKSIKLKMLNEYMYPKLSRPVIIIVLLFLAKPIFAFSHVNVLLQIPSNLDFQIILILSLLLFLSLCFIFFFWKKQKRLEEKYNELHRINHVKNQFFAIIAHDLRDPVVAFRNVSKKINHLLEFGKPNDVDKMLKMIDKAAVDLNSLLDNLLNWSKVENGKFPYEPTRINLKELCEENVQLLTPLAKTKGIKLKQHSYNDQFVMADKNAISTILRNLINNSIKFSEQGDEVIIKAKKENGKILLQVKDTGIGIAPEKMEKLFFLPDKNTTRGLLREKGKGLGLVLCKQLADMNKLDIQLQTQEGKGTLFTVSFPQN